jgi:hypothetical protein
MTTWMHCGICIDKYISISKPMVHRQFVLKYKPPYLAIVFSLGICVVILAIMVAAVLSEILEAVFDPVFGSCLFKVDLSYVGLIGSLFFVIPLLIVLLTHLMILNELRKSELRRKKMIKKSMRTAVFVVSTYYLCMFPFLVDILWKFFARPNAQPPAIFSWLTVNFLMANSSINFFIHYTCHKEFQHKFRFLMSLDFENV